MIDYKHIGSKLQEARRRAGFTQDDVAGILELSSASYISRIETGNAEVSLKMLYRLSNLYKVEPGQILLGTNTKSVEYLDQELNSIVRDFSAVEKNFAYKMLRELKDIRDQD